MRNILLILLAVLINQFVHAEDLKDTTLYDFIISIETLTLENYETDTFSISLNSPGSKLGGYDFKIALPNSLYEIVKVSPGQFYDECGWEFFNSREVTLTDEKLDFTVWQVVALSELFADSIRPGCFSSDSKVSLVDFVIRKKEGELLEEMALPIFFFWEDCSDNTISGVNGTDLYLSKQVSNFGKLPEDLVQNRFPTAKGVLQTCVKMGAPNSPKKNISFENGRIIVRYDYPADSISDK